MSTTSSPRRGEVWRINFDPSIGAEIQKKRPAVVVNEDAIGKLPLRIIVPITEWQSPFSSSPWFVQLQPTKQNGLSKVSAADALQVKSLSVRRFVDKLGKLTDREMDNIAAAIAICVGVP